MSILDIILGIMGVFFIIINAIIFYKAYVKREKSPSVSPFLGGISGAFAMFLVLTDQYMSTLKNIFIIIFGIIGAFLIIIYAIAIILFIYKKEKIRSVSPFVGEISCAFAMYLLLENQNKGMIIIPLLLDYGSIPIICEFVYVFIYDWVEEITKKQ